MLKWLRWLLVSVLAVLVLGVLGVQLLRWSAYGEQERAAVSLASVPPAPAVGSSGFAALAMSDYEVPVEAIDAEMAAEVSDYSAWLAGQGDHLLEAPRAASDGEGGRVPQVWTPRAAGRYPARAPLDHQSPLCGLGASDCLARVRADTGAMHDLMAAESARLALVDQVLAADHVHSPYPSSHQAPLPPFTTLRLSLTQAALDAVDGRVPEAMARTCRTLSAARRFTPGARDLLQKMLFPALAEGAAQLLLDLRVAHPDVALPAECTPALAPVQADDYLICEAMRGEFRMGAAFSASQDAALAKRWSPTALFSRWVLMDGKLQDAWLARTFAAPCTDEYRAEILAGQVPPPPPRAVSRADLHCYAAAISCVLAEIALPAYRDYQGRLLDHAAKLRVLLAALATVGADAEKARIEAAAASPGYDVSVDTAARTIVVGQRFWRGKGDPAFVVAF